MQVILDRYSPTVHTHLHFNDYWIILSIRDADATHSRSHLSTGPRPHNSTVTDPRDEAWALRYYVFSYSFIPIFSVRPSTHFKVTGSDCHKATFKFHFRSRSPRDYSCRRIWGLRLRPCCLVPGIGGMCVYFYRSLSRQSHQASVTVSKATVHPRLHTCLRAWIIRYFNIVGSNISLTR